MLKKLVLVGLIICTSRIILAQIPDWVDYKSRKANYSSKLYFSGFVSWHVKKKQDRNEVRSKMLENAKSALSESIKVKIESSIINQMHNLNSVSIEDFKKISRSFSNIEIAGIQTGFHFSKNKKEAYAFVWVKKTRVRTFYRNKIENYLIQVKNKLEQADKFIELGNRGSALKILHDARLLIRNIEEAQTVLIIANENDLATLNYKESIALGVEIASRTNRIKSNHDLSLNELASYLVSQLDIGTKNISKLQIESIFYKDTEMSSELSARLSDILKLNILKENIAVIEDSNPNNPDIFKLEGSYWNDGTELQIIMNLFQEFSGKKILKGSSEGWIKIETLKGAGLEFEPSNYEIAISNSEVLNDKAIVDGGSSLEFWTNKGAKGPIFKKGEMLKVYVNTTQPGYLRLLNYWANGSQLLLQDNFFISADLTNQTIALPVEWETSCPCGVEYLQAIIQSEPFDELKTEKIDGFLFLKDPIQKVVRDSRGFKDKLEKENVFIAERTISLTTLE